MPYGPPGCATSADLLGGLVLKTRTASPRVSAAIHRPCLSATRCVGPSPAGVDPTIVNFVRVVDRQVVLAHVEHAHQLADRRHPGRLHAVGEDLHDLGRRAAPSWSRRVRWRRTPSPSGVSGGVVRHSAGDDLRLGASRPVGRPGSGRWRSPPAPAPDRRAGPAEGGERRPGSGVRPADLTGVGVEQHEFVRVTFGDSHRRVSGRRRRRLRVRCRPARCRPGRFGCGGGPCCGSAGGGRLPASGRFPSVGAPPGGISPVVVAVACGDVVSGEDSWVPQAVSVAAVRPKANRTADLECMGAEVPAPDGSGADRNQVSPSRNAGHGARRPELSR